MANPIVASFVLASVLSAGPIATVSVINEDDQTYDMVIRDGRETTTLLLEPMASVNNVCASCVIDVVDVGAVVATGDQIVRIKGGAATVER